MKRNRQNYELSDFLENKTKRFLGVFFYVHLHMQMQAINSKNLLHEKAAKWNSV
jgi:hypothetical protein